MPEGRGDGQEVASSHRYQARPCTDAQGILPAIVIGTEPSRGLGTRSTAPGGMEEPTACHRARSFGEQKPRPRNQHSPEPRGQAATTPQLPAPKLGVGDDRTTKGPAQRAPHPLRVACAPPASLQTCVRMYVISDPAQPHLVLAIAETLEAIADELAAMPKSDLEVYVSQDGLAHDLNAAEQAELDEQVRARRPPSGEAA